MFFGLCFLLLLAYGCGKVSETESQTESLSESSAVDADTVSEGGKEIAQGVVGVIVAALLFLARMRLKGFKIGGTLLLYLAQFINIGWIVISHFKVSSILSEINTLIQYGVYVKTPSLIVTLLLPVAILITLYFYYSKRKRLFYN